jgi:GMP synthase-like glutamine amidotransferase
MAVERVSAPVLVLQHEGDSPVGLLDRWFAARSIEWEMRTLDDALPASLDGYAALVTLGSSLSVLDDDPWIAAELALVQRAVREQVPVLGLCFGGQILAAAAGGEVFRSPEEEFGWVQASGERSPITDYPWFCWHEDAFSAPPGAELVASSAVCAHAFTLGPHLGLQFHPEVDEPTIDRWIKQRAEPHRPPYDVEAVASATPTLVDGLAERAFELFDWWRARLASSV